MVLTVPESFRNNQEKVSSAAWDAGTGMNLPAFLLPVKPVISPWLSTIIKWDSYESEEPIVSDLRRHGIDWVMSLASDKVVFLSSGEYARTAVNLTAIRLKPILTTDFLRS